MTTDAVADQGVGPGPAPACPVETSSAPLLTATPGGGVAPALGPVELSPVCPSGPTALFGAGHCGGGHGGCSAGAGAGAGAGPCGGAFTDVAGVAGSEEQGHGAPLFKRSRSGSSCGEGLASEGARKRLCSDAGMEAL
jgi:hypothetical protein